MCRSFHGSRVYEPVVLAVKATSFELLEQSTELGRNSLEKNTLVKNVLEAWVPIVKEGLFTETERERLLQCMIAILEARAWADCQKLRDERKRYSAKDDKGMSCGGRGGGRVNRDGAHATREAHATRDQYGTRPTRARPTEWGSVCGGPPGRRVEEQGTWASRTRKRSEAGCGRPEDGGVWAAKTVKRPPQQPAQPPTHQPLGSANAETTPAGAPAAAADRKRRPDATCEGKSGWLSRAP